MNVSLRNKILILVGFINLTVVISLIYFFYTTKMEFLRNRLSYNTLLAESIARELELYLEHYRKKIESSVKLYSAYLPNKEAIIWRITGDIPEVFEGAFYLETGERLVHVSRENISSILPNSFETKSAEIFTSPYNEPSLSIVVEEEGGFYVFLLDLFHFWQRITKTYSLQPDYVLLLFSKDGKIVASPNFLNVENFRPLKGQVFSSILDKPALATFAFGEQSYWGVYLEEPLDIVLAPLNNVRRNLFLFGFALTALSFSLAFLLILRIFKPFESFKLSLRKWYKKHFGRDLEIRDDIQAIINSFRELVSELNEQRRLYKFFFENTLDGIIVFNGKGVVVDINKTACQILGVQKEELLGKSKRELVEDNLPQGNGFISQCRFKIGTKPICQIRQEAFSLRNKNFVTWRFKDISREKELENMLFRINKLAIAGEVAASIAHQINNPLASILGYAELLQMKTKDEETKKKLEGIINLARKCGESVKKFLNLSNPFEGKPSYIDPEEITLEVINLLRHKAKKKRVNLAFISEIKKKRIFSFRWQLEQVLINIIDNAIDASPPSGKVEIILKGEGKTICWIVKDEGGGVKEEIMDRIFEPFFTTKDNGSGLGLSIAKRMVESMNGSVEVRNGDRGLEVLICIQEAYNESADN